jgi:hypothetical protein
MKLKNIVEALNHFYLKKHPNASGWLIGTESIEPTKLNAYKQYKVQIFYHRPGKNIPVYTVQIVDRCPEGAEEKVKERLFTALLENIFENLDILDTYETV